MINHKQIATTINTSQSAGADKLTAAPAYPGNQTHAVEKPDSELLLSGQDRRRGSEPTQFKPEDYHLFNMGTEKGVPIEGKLLNPFHFPSSDALVEKLNKAVAEWVLEMGLMKGDDVLEEITKARFSNLVAGPCSALPENKAIVNALFVAFLFFYDDRIDQETQTLGSVETLNKNLMNTFHVQNPTSEDNLIRALSSFVAKAKAANIALDEFSHAVREYFSSAETEVNDRAGDNPISDPTTYMARREISGAVYSVFKLSSASEGIVLPDDIKISTFFSAMLRHAVRAICIANDIYSFRKECQESIPDNLIVVNMEKTGLPVEKSVKKVINLHDIEVTLYLKDKQKLMRLYNNYQYVLTKLCEIYERWMDSNHDFSSTSIRYILPST